MIPNMIGFVKPVTEIKDSAKNFPSAPCMSQNHFELASNSKSRSSNVRGFTVYKTPTFEKM